MSSEVNGPLAEMCERISEWSDSGGVQSLRVGAPVVGELEFSGLGTRREVSKDHMKNLEQLAVCCEANNIALLIAAAGQA